MGRGLYVTESFECAPVCQIAVVMLEPSGRLVSSCTVLTSQKDGHRARRKVENFNNETKNRSNLKEIGKEENFFKPTEKGDKWIMLLCF